MEETGHNDPITLLKRMVSKLQTTYEAGADNTHCAYVTRRCAVLHYRAMLHCRHWTLRLSDCIPEGTQ